MKYSIESIIAAQPVKFIFFWGHRPANDGSISKTCFSQWWESAFTVNNIAYKTAEHWMMAKKAELFNDTEIIAEILSADSPAAAKKLGRKVKNYDEALWLQHRYPIVKQGNFHKFDQHPELKEFLLNTGDRVIVEASPVDPIWGIGMAADAEGIEYPGNWKGLNLLGFVLMEVRDELQKMNK
jgi:hypothetical protein